MCAVQPSAEPIRFPSFVLLQGPAPRPHLLTLSGVETPVNLAFVEGTYALESPMEFSKLVLIVDDDLNLLSCCGSSCPFQARHAYEITSARSVADALDILLRERSISFARHGHSRDRHPLEARASTC